MTVYGCTARDVTILHIMFDYIRLACDSLISFIINHDYVHFWLFYFKYLVSIMSYMHSHLQDTNKDVSLDLKAAECFASFTT